MKFLRLTAIIFFSAAVPAYADYASDFAKANQEYAAGHFQAAGEGYSALVHGGQSNPTLFYNLANAYYRRCDLARAILNYERALTLDPHHAEATANLQFVRDQTRALELAQPPVERVLSSANPSFYTWLAVIAFWLGAFALAASFFRRSNAKTIAVFVTLFLCGGAVYALYVIENGTNGKSLAIVTAKNIEARLATADNANSILALPPGSEVKILSNRGDWSYAALPNNLRGWIPTKSAELIRL